MKPRALKRMLRSAPKEVLTEIENEGWTLSYTKSCHVRWEHPNGAVVYSSSTPSCWRAWKNHINHMRQAAQGKHGPMDRSSRSVEA